MPTATRLRSPRGACDARFTTEHRLSRISCYDDVFAREAMCQACHDPHIADGQIIFAAHVAISRLVISDQAVWSEMGRYMAEMRHDLHLASAMSLLKPFTSGRGGPVRQACAQAFVAQLHATDPISTVAIPQDTAGSSHGPLINTPS